MTFRTILAAASGGSASEGTIELACRWAVALDAHVEGFHAVSDPREVFLATGSEVPIYAPEILDRLRDEAAATAARTRALFEAVALRHDLPTSPHPPAPAASAGWREESGYAPELVARRARFFDLVVLGRSARAVGEPHTVTIEKTLEESGRPVMLAPAACPPTIGEAAAIAWNGSPEAVRAVAAALPLLVRARAVCALMIGAADNEASLSLLIEYLSWHGIEAARRALPLATGQSIGAGLLEAAGQAQADLLVMGGFGRRPWREAVFGGATRELLKRQTMPLLLVH